MKIINKIDFDIYKIIMIMIEDLIETIYNFTPSYEKHKLKFDKGLIIVLIYTLEFYSVVNDCHFLPLKCPG